MFTTDQIRKELVGTIVSLAGKDPSGRDHPSVRTLAQSILSFTSEATNDALDLHMARCDRCQSRFIIMAQIAERGMLLGRAASEELRVPISPGQALLARHQ